MIAEYIMTIHGILIFILMSKNSIEQWQPIAFECEDRNYELLEKQIKIEMRRLCMALYRDDFVSHTIGEV